MTLRLVLGLLMSAAAFADAGVTEVVFDPTVGSLDEVDRLAAAVL